MTERLRNNNSYEEFERNSSRGLITSKQLLQGEWFTLDSFYYENGKITKAKRFSRDKTVLSEQDFYWEGEVLKSGYLVQFQKENGKIVQYDMKYNFKYDNNNITEVERMLFLEDGDTSLIIKNFQHDLNENYKSDLPFSPLNLVFDFTLENVPYWFSQNNVINEVRRTKDGHWISEKSLELTLENDKVAKIISTTQSNTSDDKFVRSITLEYDCW